MRVVAVASSKGGVGKTSLIVHLAAGLAADGERVLLVDLDPGGHATTWLRGDREPIGIAEAVIAGELLQDHVVQPVEDRGDLWLAPCSAALDTLDAAMAGQFGRETILRDVLRAKRTPQFDTVLIDCPPEKGFLTQSAIFAADGVIVPILPGYLGLSGLVDVRMLIEQIRKRGRARVGLLGCVIFGADGREGTPEETREAVKRIEASALFRSEVRYSAAAKRLPETRALAWDSGADPRGYEDYQAVLRETRARLER